MKIGFIGGAGSMASLYAKILQSHGNEILVSDKDKELLKKTYSGLEARVCNDNKEVARLSDLVIYSTPLSETPRIIEESAPFMKENATAGGFTSVKTFEVDSLIKYSPKDANIITFHPLHGPSLSPENQTLIILPVRAEEKKVKEMSDLFSKAKVRISYINSAKEHDRIMADVQALVHFNFLSMGNAWRMLDFNPQDNPTYQNEVDRLKALFTKRILSQNPEVYAGIAIFNPEAKSHVRQYVNSLDSIMEKVIKEDRKGLESRWNEIVMFLGKEELETSDELLDKIFHQKYLTENQTNSYLSQIVLGDSFMKLGIKPKENIAFHSPPYKILSMLTHKILNGDSRHYIRNAVDNLETKRHDYYFCKSATILAEIIESGDYSGFIEFFRKSAEFFGKEELEAAKKETDNLISRLADAGSRHTRR